MDRASLFGVEWIAIAAAQRGSSFMHGTGNILASDLLHEEYPSNFSYYIADKTFVSIGGYGSVFGTLSVNYVRIIDGPGYISLDGSFNRGSYDGVQLPGSAADWQVELYGSAARLVKDRTTVVIPSGQNKEIVLVFDDQYRSMRYDTQEGVIKLYAENGQEGYSEQTVTSIPQPIDVTVTTVTDLMAFDDFYGKPTSLYVSPGEPVTVSGAMIYGSQGVEHVVLNGGWNEFDGSFNRGGDIITLRGPIEQYKASVVGSRIELGWYLNDDIAYAAYLKASIPVGTAGLELRFDEGSRTLIYDSELRQVLIGDQAISGELTALSAFG